MANYTIRVQLDGNPSYEQYERLHSLMAHLGFGRTVTGSKTIELPHATYYGSTASRIEQVRDVVRDQVKATIQNNIKVFVAQTETWAMGW
jgi:hypothetical protein